MTAYLYFVRGLQAMAAVVAMGALICAGEFNLTPTPIVVTFVLVQGFGFWFGRDRDQTNVPVL